MSQFFYICDKCDCSTRKSKKRQIIVLRMQSAQIFKEIIYVNVFQVSGQTQRQFSPILAMTLMSVQRIHLVMLGIVIKFFNGSKYRSEYSEYCFSGISNFENHKVHRVSIILVISIVFVTMMKPQTMLRMLKLQSISTLQMVFVLLIR